MLENMDVRAVIAGIVIAVVICWLLWCFPRGLLAVVLLPFLGHAQTPDLSKLDRITEFHWQAKTDTISARLDWTSERQGKQYKCTLMLGEEETLQCVGYRKIDVRSPLMDNFILSNLTMFLHYIHDFTDMGILAGKDAVARRFPASDGCNTCIEEPWGTSCTALYCEKK